MDRSIRRLPIVVLAILLSLGAPASAGFLENLFAPQPDLWERWAAHDPESTATIDHGAWQGFVETYVSKSDSGVNLIDYRGVSDADKRLLDDYIARLEATPISEYKRAEQLAYWINLYNALTMQVVLEHYPVDSIRDIDISPGFFGDGPWGKALVEIEGEPVTLNDIEHRILRPIWQDPRIHYAVNCASIGCPNLQRTAFTADNTPKLMDTGAREYVNHPRGASVEDGGLIVSSVYTWFQEDFGGDDAGVIRHLRRYARPQLASKLAERERIADDRYDWTLNDTAR